MISIRCCYRGYKINQITYSEMLDLIQKYNVTIIDVRSEQEHREGHIDGSINVPLCYFKNRIGNYVRDKDQIIVVYCSAGVRSQKAAEFLKMHGFNNVFNCVIGDDLF